MDRSFRVDFVWGLMLCVAGSVLPVTSANAAALGTDNRLVVLRVGDGAAVLTGASTRVFLDEYSVSFTAGMPTGASHVQSIPVPFVTDPLDSNFGTALTVGGSSALEGGLNFSTNGQYLMFGGYHAALGEPVGSKRKIVGRLDLAGNVTLDAMYGPGATSANVAPRSVASTDGSSYYLGMAFSGANGGVHYRPFASGNDNTVMSTVLTSQSTRRVEIFDGQLYIGSADSNVSPIFGVATVGSGLPTTAGQTVTILPGMPTATGSPFDFFFADENTLYVADDRAFNSTTQTGNTNGGLQKWVQSEGTWSRVYTKNIDTLNDAFDYGLRGLQGSVDESGNVTLFATTTWGPQATPVANYLVGISDTLANTSAENVMVNSLVTAAANTNLRSLEVIGIDTGSTQGLPGDYNEDQFVDAADYVIWRKMHNPANPGAPALPNDDTAGVLDDDYDRWFENFGESSPGSGGNSGASVPEPGAFALVALAFVVVDRRRRRA